MKSSFGMVLFATRISQAWRLTAGIRSLIFITALFQLSTISAAQTLPYFPTSIFIPQSKPEPAQENATADIAYIFSPQDDWVDLLALNFSNSLQASSLSFQTLSSNVPFLDTNKTAFTPSLADNGSLIVYAGDCSAPAGSEIWTFYLSSVDGASSWSRANTTLATDANSIQAGPSFLGGGFSFSNILEPQLSPAVTYVYGGMCPGTAASNASLAQSNATYSNQMIKIAPLGINTGEFTVSPVSSKGPPVAEAGFSFTSLSPSISNHSGTVTQQVNYVLLGGHTKTAFINMSTVAIWSLPEESWSFISNIDIVGSSSTNTELAIKSTLTSIDSRSGHTAVLSEDGTSLIILGGWVGDLTQTASPQLAILNIGASYGGKGDWEWVVPDTQPSGPGIYGHGAALLPGNVMMVYGGYTISPAETKVRRQASSSNDVPMFLNLTSMSWSNDYTNPTYNAVDQGNNSSSTANGDLGLRLGLGLGLGLGIAAIIIAIVIYLLYRRRLRHRRTIRNSAIRALAQDTSRFLPHDDEMTEHDQAWYTGGGDPYMRGSRSLGYQSLQANRGSLDQGQGPHSWFGGAPTQGQGVLRKPLPRRNTYDPHSAVIHPIAEADEDDGGILGGPISPLRNEGRKDSDPFLTPTQTQENNEKYDTPIALQQPARVSLTPSPERATDPEVQDWMSDVEAVDALLSGRRSAQQSPTRWALDRLTGEDERTESNVSESNRSNLNLNTNINTAVSRSDSIRSHLRAGFGVAAAALAAAVDEGRGGSSSSSTPSYNTARSSFPALQAEGPGLLMGGRMRGGDKEREEEPGSPSKRKPRRSFFGSLRRVFSGATPDASPIERYGKETRDDTEGEASDYDARLGGLSGIAAGGVLRRKSGRGAWEALEQSQPGRDRNLGQGLGQRGIGNGKGKGVANEEYLPRIGNDDDDDEWDIEKAVERRLVQVMFTVPKEPLRVVNAEPDIESGEDVVLVNPDEETLDEKGKDVTTEAEEMRRNLEIGDRGVEAVEERDLGTLIPSPSPVSEDDILREVREELEAEWRLDKGKEKEKIRYDDDEDRGRQPETPVRTPRNLRDESARLLGGDLSLSTESRKRKPSRSPVQDSDGDVFSAQAVRLERPRTRVLAMVESIESLSRENSPSGSPTR
ncbi:uncharacterized protein GGS22DRAFT_152665 [Annulohypoxylon maeteangense]|uniref:uncharacterized protein n=1 Tax=Annulohypoxylon maeteangense TaxID=1927788 RepID=UPI002007FF55|nr:uncharacterized protein GGS22DRAFT_152665 [Annulohypoxylon maeteangense]KAI0888904.1 hypothetical protein GGS22DRAFT_152665 [Annulohypoxylon maeteangense]